MIRARSGQSGFTLLELLVATTILGIAVAALLGGLSNSVRNAARVSEYDAITMAARQKMEELLAEPALPRYRELSGSFGNGRSWRARMTPYDLYSGKGAGAPVLDRVELEAFWQSGSQQKSIRLEGYRRGVLLRDDILAGGLAP